MKLSTIHLVKFKKLSRRLGISFFETVGLLEGVWLFAQTNARDGDLRKFDAEDLAAWLEWDASETDLVTALVECCWLDVDENGNLSIHDWMDHAPNWVRGVIKRSEQEKIPSPQPSTAPSPQPSTAPSPQPSRDSGLLSPQPSTEPTPQPPSLLFSSLLLPKEKKPPNPLSGEGGISISDNSESKKPKPRGRPKKSTEPVRPSTTPDYPERFDAAWRAYPERDGTKTGKPAAYAAWRQLSESDQELFESCVRNFATFAASGAFLAIPDMHRWLSDPKHDWPSWRELSERQRTAMREHSGGVPPPEKFDMGAALRDLERARNSGQGG